MKLEIPELEIQQEIKKCKSCMFEKYLEDENGDCTITDLIKDLNGIDCVRDEIIFVKKEVWVECNRYNINVGDKVRLNEGKYYPIANVDFIFLTTQYGYNDFVVTYIDNNQQALQQMNKFETNTNK